MTQCVRACETCVLCAVLCCVNGSNLKWCLHVFMRHENELCKCLSRALSSHAMLYTYALTMVRVRLVSLAAFGRNAIHSFSFSVHCVRVCACLFMFILRKCRRDWMEWTRSYKFFVVCANIAANVFSSYRPTHRTRRRQSIYDTKGSATTTTTMNGMKRIKRDGALFFFFFNFMFYPTYHY